MPLSLTQLRTITTVPEAREFLLANLRTFGFKVDAWPDNGIARITVEIGAVLMSRYAETVDGLSRLPFLQDCDSEALKMHAKQRYLIEPFPAEPAVLTLQLRNSSTIAATFGATEVVVRDRVSGVSYQSTAAVSIAPGATAPVAVTALTPGRIQATSISQLELSAAGITITGVAITAYGFDEESRESLARRCILRPAKAALHLVPAKAEAVVRDANRKVNRITWNRTGPRGPFTCDHYIATDGSPLTTEELAALQEEIDGCSITIGANLVRIADQQEISPTGALHYVSGYDADRLRYAVESAIVKHLASVPIGGQVIGPGLERVLVLSELEEAIRKVPGVRSVTLVGTNPTITAYQVPVLGNMAALTFTRAYA